MENAVATETLLKELGYVLQSLVEKRYTEQFKRIIFNINSDFYVHFPNDKEFFALFVEDGILKYYAFIDMKEAKRALACFKKLGDKTHYCMVSRAIAQMAGREHEFYQYCEMMADSDEEAAQYALKQQEIIDFIFSAP